MKIRTSRRRSRIATIGLVVAAAAIGALLLTTLVSIITPKTPPSKPTAIKGVPGNQSVSLSWSASTYATDYIIEQTDLASARVQQLPDQVRETTSRVTGLATGHWYRFRVIPVNRVFLSATEGTPSDPIVIRTTGFQGSYDHYYVLGDSYSSGEGASPYSGTTECFQSTQSYPYLLGSGVSTPVVFACSGATTADIDTTVQHPDLSSAQLQRLQNSPTGNSLITLTIGGNDVGFAQELERCIFSFISCTDRQEIIAQKITALEPRLVQVYREIHHAAPTADIIVLGYPLLVASPDTASCTNPIVSLGLSADKMTMIRQLAGQLDNTITQAATEAGIVSAAGQVEQAFAGHEVCTPNQNDEWINEFTGLTSLGHGSFHPNASGYLADARVVNARRTELYQTGMVLSSQQLSS